MKAVLISIQPKWVEMIVSGQKTIEVRKTKPKLETPFKCYIYETKDNRYESIGICGYKKDGTPYSFVNQIGKVIGEFVCDKIYEIKPYFDRPDLLTQYECGWKHGEDFDCLSFSELDSYLGENDGFGWHISDLKIYDKPKELSEFKKPCDRFLDCITCKRLVRNDFLSCDNIITRPPQSWCYVEANE